MPSSGVRDVSVTLVARIVVVVLGVGVQSCLAWFLGPEARGAYAVAVVWSSLLTVTFAFGVDGATQYWVAADRTTLRRGVSALLLLEAIASLIGMAAAVLALRLPLAFFSKADESAFLLAIVTFPAEMVSAALLLLLGSRREFTAQALMMTLRMSLRLALLVALLWGAEMGVQGALIANLISFALVAALNLEFLRRRHDFRWEWPDGALLRGLLGYGSRYYFAAFSTLVNAQVGVIMVAMLASTEEVGLFSTAVALVTYALMLSDVVGAAIHPRIAADPGGRPDLAAQSARVVGIVTSLALLLIASLASPIVEFLLSPSFLPTVPLVRIIALGIAYRAATKVLVHYFNAIDRPGVFSLSTAVGVIGNAGLLVMLLPSYGLPGAAWAMTIGYLLSGTVLVVEFRRQSKMGLLESWLPRRSDLDLARVELSRLRERLCGQEAS